MAKASKPKLKESYGLYINGKWVAASDKGTFETHNPANGEKLADCAEATKKDVDKAVKAAWKAFDSWKRVDPSVRSKILLDIADRIEANADLLAEVETLDNGKPIRETKGVDVPLAVDHFRYFAGVIRSEEGSARLIQQGPSGVTTSRRLPSTH